MGAAVVSTFETVVATFGVLLPAVCCYGLLRRTQNKFRSGEAELPSVIASWICLALSLIGTGVMIFRMTDPPSNEDEAFKFLGMLYFYFAFSCVALPVIYLFVRSASAFVAWLFRCE